METQRLSKETLFLLYNSNIFSAGATGLKLNTLRQGSVMLDQQHDTYLPRGSI